MLTVSMEALRSPRRARHVQPLLHKAMIESPQQFLSVYNRLGAEKLQLTVDNGEPFSETEETGALLVAEISYLHEAIISTSPALAGSFAAVQGDPRVVHIKQENQGPSPGFDIARQVLFLSEAVHPLATKSHQPFILSVFFYITYPHT